MIHAKCRGFGKGRVINCKKKIRECLRHSNREFGRRWRLDQNELERNGRVVLVK
jgi:hypothetical protein